ncbi:hypothetical protein WKI68_39295 [Streptomyces sp. MS1.HAVA.3]|uniref:Acyltransferase 3 domain-containing protein n=1 Tax=Streptomyces caledonius TaxID=3134107 RepID=A0ABU8UEA6_9ACTN
MQTGDRTSAGAAGGRLAVLDGIRVLAALAVLFYHYAALESAWGEPTAGVFPSPTGSPSTAGSESRSSSWSAASSSV